METPNQNTNNKKFEIKHNMYTTNHLGPYYVHLSGKNLNTNIGRIHPMR